MDAGDGQASRRLPVILREHHVQRIGPHRPLLKRYLHHSFSTLRTLVPLGHVGAGYRFEPVPGRHRQAQAKYPGTLDGVVDLRAEPHCLGAHADAVTDGCLDLRLDELGLHHERKVGF